MKRNKTIRLPGRLVVLLLAAVMTLTNALAMTKAPEPGTGTAHGVDLQMVDSFPADGDKDVGFMPTIYCKFNHNVCDSNLSPGNLACLGLQTEDGTAVDISTYVIDPQVDFLMRQFLIMEPKEPLSPNTTYVVSMVPGIQARNGMVTGQTFTFRFTTGAEDRMMGDPFEEGDTSTGNQPPKEVTVEVTDTYPFDKAENVRLQTSMEFRFNCNVTGGDLAEANLPHLSLTDEYGVPVEIRTYTEDPTSDLSQRQMLHMKSVSPLLPSTTYVARVSAGVTANNGVSSVQDYEFTFTTTDKPLSEEAIIDPNGPRPTPKPVPEAKPRESEQPEPSPTAAPVETQLPEEAETPVPTAVVSAEPDTDETTQPEVSAVPMESEPPATEENGEKQPAVGILVLVLALAAGVIVLLVLHKRKMK